jgi:HNH endonuclease
VTDPRLLKASHIKPWRSCITSAERLDGHNGLPLLCPNVDHLFDRGYISFGDHGSVLVSPLIDATQIALHCLATAPPSNVGPFRPGQAACLAFHRESVFLGGAAIRQTAVTLPGVYRIRYAGGTPEHLLYVGQTAQTLRERLLSLAAGVNAEECPFNDPHTAAPHLWLLRRLNGARLECSCAPVAGDAQILHGTEDMLLWRHRVETGLSAQANYGRFYPGYVRPTNRWIVRGGRSGIRTPGRRAALLPNGSEIVNFAVSQAALRGKAGPLQASWWQRAHLTEARFLPRAPAVYCIHDRGAEQPVYVGQTSSAGTSGGPAVHLVRNTVSGQVANPRLPKRQPSD